MPNLTDPQLADALLSVASTIITDVPWFVVPLRGLGLVLAWDRREDADPGILEALASERGEVVASSLDHRDVAGRQLVAVMFRPADDLNEAAGTLRAAYLIATSPDNVIDDDDPDGPF